MISNINITVTSAYREAIRAEYPLLDTKKGYWALFQYLIFGTFFDRGTENLVLSAAMCADFEGKIADTNYAAHKFLAAFSKDITPLTWSQPASIGLTHRANVVTQVIWPDKVTTLTKNERRRIATTEDRVWLVSGNKYRRQDAATMRNEFQAEALRMLEYRGCKEAFGLLTYINNLPNNSFSKILKNIEKAREVAIALDEDTENQLNILMQIETVQQPFYRAVDKTTRIYTMHSTFLGLKREIRKVITQDWIQCDLASAQLAIIAKIWNLPSIEAYLRDGKKIWPDLCAAAGLDFDEDNKSIMKKVLYALTFGAQVKSIEEELEEDFGAGCGKIIWQRLEAHGVIKEMLAARKVQIKKLRSEGFGVDAFGIKTEVMYEPVEGKPYKTHNCRSILACQAQSYELLLLYPVVQYAMQNQEEFVVMNWLHDGFSIAVKHESHRQAIVHKLTKLVADKAAELGIFTSLEVS